MHTHERWIKDSLQHTHTSKQTCLHDIIGLDKCFLGLEQTAAYKHRFLWETGQSGSVRMFVCPHLLFQLARMDTNFKVVISKIHRRSVFHSPCVSFWSHMLNHDCTYASCPVWAHRTLSCWQVFTEMRGIHMAHFMKNKTVCLICKISPSHYECFYK